MADLNDRTINVSLHDDTSEAAVTTTTSGSKVYLDTVATIVNNESPTKYQLKVDYDATGDTLTSASDTELFSYTGDGVIDFIAVSNSTTSNYIVAIEIDSVERIRITMSQLGSDLYLTSGSSPFWTEVANKNFRYHPNSEVGFTTSFRVLARATGSNTTVTHFVAYREKVD